MIKNVVKNSWANDVFRRHKDKAWLDNHIKEERKRLKGCFIENIMLGYSNNDILIERYYDLKELKYKQLDGFVKQVIISGFTTYRTITERLNWPLEEMNYTKIKCDIVNTILDPALKYLNRASIDDDPDSIPQPPAYNLINSYKSNFLNNYNIIVDKCKQTAYNGWRNGLPSADVMKLFPNSYIYKERKRKWDWLRHKTPEEVVKGFIERDIVELSPSMKTALKRIQGLSIKVVNDLLKKTVSEMDQTTVTKLKNKAAINDWFFNLDGIDQQEVIEQIKKKRNNAFEIQAYTIHMVQTYGYKPEWMIDGKMHYTKAINDFIQSDKK